MVHHQSLARFYLYTKNNLVPASAADKTEYLETGSNGQYQEIASGDQSLTREQHMEDISKRPGMRDRIVVSDL